MIFNILVYDNSGSFPSWFDIMRHCYFMLNLEKNPKTSQICFLQSFSQDLLDQFFCCFFLNRYFVIKNGTSCYKCLKIEKSHNLSFHNQDDETDRVVSLVVRVMA